MTRPISFADVQEAADTCLSSDRGIAIDLGTYGRAIHYRQRFYRFRKHMRNKSVEVYQPGDPMYDRTPYDCINIPTPPKGTTVIRMEKTQFSDLKVTML